MVGSDIGDINSPTHAGSRSTRVDPKLLANLQISLETDENGDTSSGYFVAGLVSSTTQLRNGWTKQRIHLWNLGKRSRIAERRTKRCT